MASTSVAYRANEFPIMHPEVKEDKDTLKKYFDHFRIYNYFGENREQRKLVGPRGKVKRNPANDVFFARYELLKYLYHVHLKTITK